MIFIVSHTKENIYTTAHHLDLSGYSAIIE